MSHVNYDFISINNKEAWSSCQSTVEIDCLCSLFRNRTQENYRLLSDLSSYWHRHNCFKGIFKVDNFFLEHKVMWSKCKAVSTDDARATVTVHNRVVALMYSLHQTP